MSCSRAEPRWLALALAVIALFVFSPCVHYDYLVYDDGIYVFKNKAVLNGLSLEGLVYAFGSFEGGSWMPLTWLSHLLDTTLFGPGPAGRHLMGLVLHTLASGTLLLALHRLTGKLWLSALSAAIFALHPLRTESVVWISERKDVLSGFFFALGLIAYAGYVAKPGALRYSWVVICLVLGLMAKPMLVTLPFVFLLLDFWPLRRMGCCWMDVSAKIWPLVREKIPLFFVVLASCTMTYLSQKHTGAFSRWSSNGWTQTGDIFGNYSFYLSKLFVPLNRTVIYPEDHFPYPILIVLAIGLTSFTGFVIWKAFQWPWLMVGWLWFLGTLAPVIGIVPVGMAMVADRYTYLPSIGIGIAAVWSMAAAVQGRKAAKQVALVLATVLILGFALMTSKDLPRWRDSRELFESALGVAPHKIAYDNLAEFFINQGDYDRAIELATCAIELDPEYGASYSARAMAYVCKDDYLEAKKNYDEAVRLGDRPLGPIPRRDFMIPGGTDPESQWEQFTAVVGLEPRTPEAYVARAESRVKFGATDLAIADCSKAIDLKSDFAAAYNARGGVFNLAGDAEAAIRDSSHAIALNPNYADAYTTRAIAHTRLGKYTLALQDNSKAIELSPTNALVHHNRAVTFFMMKNFELAWKDVERCRELGGKPHESFVRMLSEASGRKP